MSHNYPNQHTSISEKKKEEWYKPTYDFIIHHNLLKKDVPKIQTWLDAANGIVSSSTINYALTPIVSESGETFEYPAEIRDVDLINVIREKNLGEYIELPYRFHVNVSNEDAIEKRNIEVTNKLYELVESTFVTMLQAAQAQQQQQQANQVAQGQAVGQPTVKPEIPPMPNFEQYAKEYINTWLDERAIQGQHILELVNNYNNFETKRLQAYYYWWATEEFYTYREVNNNEVYTSVIHPLEGYPGRNSELFVEDYDSFVIKKKITWDEAKHKYKDKIPVSEVAYFNDLVSRDSGSAIKANPIFMSTRFMSTLDKSNTTNRLDSQLDVMLTDDSRILDEYTIIWRTERPVKYVTRINQMGQEEQEIVEDSYKKNSDLGDIKIQTEWIEEVWIGKRLGTSGIGLYLEPEPCAVQRYDKHRNRPKLPVGGKCGLLHGILQNPIPARLIPYNIIDRLISLNIERAIARYQDSITLIPQSLINSDSSGTYKEKMFYMKADGKLIYDDTQIDHTILQYGFTIKQNTGLENYMMTLIKLREQYRNEALAVANMNPERMGNIDPTAGKGNTEQNIYRAKLGSLLSITMFNAALERDHNADLEFSKVAYAGGKIGSYFDSKSGQNIIVDVDPQKHLDSDYGVFVRNTKIEDDKIQQYKQFAFSAAQNGEFELATAAIEGDTIPELRNAMKKIITAKQELDKNINDQKNETAKYVSDMQKQIADTKNQIELEKAQISSDTMIRVAEINNQYDPAASDLNTDKLSDAAERLNERELDFIKHKDDMEMRAGDQQIKRDELSIKKQALNKTTNNKK